MVKKSVFLLISLIFLSSVTCFAKAKEEVVALLTAKVATTYEEHGIPIPNARIIIINSSGEIIGTELTDDQGIATVAVKVPADPRFPMKHLGDVTVIAVANGYNEFIDFSVPVNEYDDHTARVFLPLWEVKENRRNEPQFRNGSFHRFTVFKMLDYYAKEIGLKRQNIPFDIGKEPPWGPEIKIK